MLPPLSLPLSARLNRIQWLGLLPALARGVAIALGAAHTLAAISQYSMNEDGIAYLDIADAYWQGNWPAALNPVWSPLYSWVLAPVLGLLRPAMRWQFAVVQVVNFGLYLVALLAFEYYWRQLTRDRQDRASASGGALTLPARLWPLLGYALFIWTSLSLIEIWSVTPDMLTAALVYLAAGLVLRLRRGEQTHAIFAGLGAVLGLAYLSKSVMFPLALVLLGLSLLSAPRPRAAAGPFTLAVLVFALVAGPFVAAISLAKGRLTIGEAGTLTYVRYVNGVPYPHWQGGPPASGVPLHPSRLILADPPIYEFATPVGGTYPISYDPSYWYEGVTPHYGAADLARGLLSSALYYDDLFVRQQGLLLLSVVVLYGLGGWRGWKPAALVRCWGLALFAVAAFALYAPVYVEGRYLGVFVTLFWGDLLAGIQLPEVTLNRKLAAWLSGAMLVGLLNNILVSNLEGLNALASPSAAAPGPAQAAPAPNWPGEVAEELHRLGIQPGETVGVIGYGFSSFWARLAGVQIGAELLGTQAGPFWTGDAALQARVLAAFAQSGAQAIVAEDAPATAELPGWHRVGQSSYFIYLLGEREDQGALPRLNQ